MSWNLVKRVIVIFSDPPKIKFEELVQKPVLATETPLNFLLLILRFCEYKGQIDVIKFEYK